MSRGAGRIAYTTETNGDTKPRGHSAGTESRESDERRNEETGG